jgi:tRNA(Arg) A34 adenosine deaminase TadA
MWMKEALREADVALASGEVPVGCVLVDLPSGRIVGRGRNATNVTKNVRTHSVCDVLLLCAVWVAPVMQGTRHAEFVAVDETIATGYLVDGKLLSDCAL